NNMHSNIAVWYMGMGTSRVNGSEGNLATLYEKNYKNNRHFLFHAHDGGAQNLWTQTQMYYKLWMYYHLTGHNTSYYPMLFELNRRDRMSSNNLGWIDGKGHASGKESMLKYYKQACMAAGEDLTEFFRAHGFFMLMEQEERGDYATSFYTQTQQEVDEAIAWVKAQGYKENLAPLFITDAVATPSYSHDGKTRRSYWDGETARGENATIGMYTDFLDESVEAEGYLYTLYKTTLSIMHEGAKGAVGFIVYDENDNLVAFTNNYSLNLPVTATKVKIYAVQADGTKVEVMSAAEGGTEEQQIEALKKAITAANSLISKSGNSKMASYLKASAVAELQEMVSEAQAALDNKDQSQYTYGAWAMNLTNLTNEIKTDPNAFVGIKTLNHYELRCAEGNFGYRLAFYENGVKAASNTQVANDNRRWEFVPVEGEEGVYYIRNVGQNKFIIEVGNGSNALLGTSLAAGSQKFTILYNGDGTASILKASEPNVSLYRNTDNSIVGKEPGEKRSQWRIELYTDNATAVEVANLEALVAEAERVIAEAGNGIDNLAVYVSDIELANFVRRVIEAKEAAEAALDNQASVSDFMPYIKALETAIANTEAVYVLKPQSSHGETIYYYYLKDVDAGTYAFVNPDATGKYVDAMGAGELDTENDNYVWAFVKNSKGELQIYNKGYDAYLYTLSSSPNSLKADKAADAGNYVFSVDNDRKAIVITEDGKYLYNQSGKARMYRTKTDWKLELVGTEEGTLTSIVEVETEATTPVLEGIFDLTGRKIEEITKSGIYIINGKKTLVK
ncbi:MAG: RICIN domain-containing protein, partial [Bacteroidaceae bacterium]|nr:RICIN domain-containing protein [Bacteroidaceae bacterium]